MEENENPRITPEALARLIVYVIGAIAGAVVLILGGIHNRPELVGVGLGLLGTNALAGANVPGVNIGRNHENG